MSSSDSSDNGDPTYREMSDLRKLDMLRTAVADGDWGLPLKCPCGGRIVEEISPTEIEKKRYMKCVNYEDDGLHRRKYWVHAIEEETKSLRKEVDKHGVRLRELASHEVRISLLKDHVLANDAEIVAHEGQISEVKEQVQAKDEEVAKLKELVQAKDDEVAKLKELVQAKDDEIARIKDLLHAFDSRILTLEHCCFDSP